MGLIDKVTRAGANAHVALYRRTTSDRLRTVSGLPVLLLTVRGRKSGKDYTTPVCYIEELGGYAVTGSKGGADTDPQWFRNLRSADEAVIEIGTERRNVRVRELTGAERDRAWQRFVTEGRSFGGYESKTDRTIPVALLTPV